MKRIAVCLVMAGLFWKPAWAQVNMPDPSLIHGRAIPAPELALGTVTVRVVRESIGNNVAGQEVRLTVGEGTRTAVTDAEGRAEFPNLPAGAGIQARATVDGEALESESFQVPAAGGLRVILVAGIAEATARREREQAAEAAAPPVKGTVVIGGDSRILMEFRDDRLQVFYVLQIVNSARNRVDIGGPILLDLPTGAAGAAILEGSSPTASVSGDRVTVTGPFAPGNTLVQVGFQLLFDDPDITVEQRWPVAVEQVTVAMERVAAAAMSSTQFAKVGEVQANDGTPYTMGEGPSLAAGDTLVLQLTNLPVHSKTPRYTALGLAAAVIGFGVWLGFAGRSKSTNVRRRLTDRRDSLMGELVQLERRARNGATDAKHATRRQKLLLELERIYGELDEAGPGAAESNQGARA